jgi:carboxypeptidase C (cathepsin A)
MRRLTLLAATLLVAVSSSAIAQDGNAPMPPAFLRAMEPMIPRGSAIEPVVTHHSSRIGGRALRYKAIVTELPMPGADGAPVAVGVSYGYVAEGKGEPAKRPVLFVFNGGPGASSSPLHLQAFGPRRMAGAQIEDNPHSLLDVADLVFIDPVGTGASMPIKDRDASSYWGVGGDARGVSAMIEAWCRANGRTASPRILMGESYGTTRALAILKEDMEAKEALPDAVILLALAIGDSDGPVLGEIVHVPTYAATAWYHGAIDRGGRTLAQHYADALAFAQTDYASALIRGPALPAAERTRVAQRMAQLTGIPASTIESRNLRLGNYDFMLGLLAAKDLRTGQLDARKTRAIEASKLRPPFDDPSMTLGANSTAQIEAYLSDELGYTLPSAYRSLNLGINFRWLWDKDYGGSYRALSLAPFLKAAIDAKPSLRVFAAGGYYDITTPLYAGQFALEQAGLPASNVTYARYAAGHSIFEDEPELAKLSADLRRMVTQVAREHEVSGGQR